MVLPKEVLLNILQHLRRCELDWIMLVNRLMCGIVLANNKALARRVVEKATVHGPIGDGQVSKLRLFFTKPEKLKRRAAVRTSDGHRMELIGTWKEQIGWFLKALRHAHVKHLAIGCAKAVLGEEVIMSKKTAALIAMFSPTISVEVLELGSVLLHKLSSKQFSNAVLSFQSLSTLTTRSNTNPGGHFTDDFLRRAGHMGVKFTHILDAKVWELFFNCTSVTDEGVLDYLFNPAYSIRDRSLQIHRCRLSKNFLFKLCEKIHTASAADVDDISFWSHMRLGSQTLGKYKPQQEHVTVKGVRITCIRFRNDEFCATISFNRSTGWMRSCRLTTIKEKYDKVFRFV
ncbi:hypothetical protein AAVH_13856 [Aphelenchoides avenae]|nr:hypothetical protein AAVH_13856 [Aphelenchus avenae]